MRADMRISGAKDSYERSIRVALASLPQWLVVGARVPSVVISLSAEVREMRAAYQHDSRVIYLSPGVGDVLRVVLAHELAHGVDDWAPGKSAHRFSRSEGWMGIWRQASGFRQKKFRDMPQEYFADAVSLAATTGLSTYGLAHPYEAAYIQQEVIPAVASTQERGSQ